MQHIYISLQSPLIIIPPSTWLQLHRYSGETSSFFFGGGGACKDRKSQSAPVSLKGRLFSPDTHTWRIQNSDRLWAGRTCHLAWTKLYSWQYPRREVNSNQQIPIWSSYIRFNLIHNSRSKCSTPWQFGTHGCDGRHFLHKKKNQTTVPL